MGTNDRRERVLDAALQLIARDGFDGVRISDIAAQAGVSAALVHYHFANRVQLLTEALTQSLSAAEARLEHAAAGTHRQDPAERLADLIDFGLPLIPEDVTESCLWAELELRASGSPELAASLAALNARIMQPLADAVAAGRESGVFRRGEPDEVAAVALALLSGLSTRLTSNDPALTLADARRMAGRQLALAVGYEGELPFRPLPTPPGSLPARTGADASAPEPAAPRTVGRRRRAPSRAARP